MLYNTTPHSCLCELVGPCKHQQKVNSCVLDKLSVRPVKYIVRTTPMLGALKPLARPGPLRHRPLLVLAGGKRRPLIKRRPRLLGSQRKKQRYQDDPDLVKLIPGQPVVEGRLTTDINTVNGPQQLYALVTAAESCITTQQLSMALARLAGFKSAPRRFTSAQNLMVRTAAEHCVALLKQKGLDPGTDHTSFARMAMALAHLGTADKDLLDAIVLQSEGKLHLFKPDSAASLLAGLTACQHRPSDTWLQRYCLEVYVR